jgi:transposase
MMAALIAGERDPKALAQLARTRMRAKITQLEEAFTDHHAFLLARMLARVDAITTDIAAIEDRIGEQIAPFVAAVDWLDEIPGIGPISATVIIAEAGIDMSHFPTAGHTWCPGHASRPESRNQPARRRARPTPSSVNATGVSPNAAARNAPSCLSAAPILIIVWHLLANPDTRYQDLGPGFYDTRTGPDRKKRNHVRQLEALGYKVTLESAA